MQNNFLNVENFTKKFGEFTAVDDVSFSIEEGEAFALLGESGCGKTTLLRCIAGLETGNAGKVSVAGNVFYDQKPLVPVNKRNIGLVFQDYAVFPHKSIAENITFGVRDKSKKSFMLEEMLKLFKLEDQRNKMPDQLSGGQLQRVAIARTLASSPSLVLLDEPFSNLDKQLGVVLRHELKAIFSSQKLASILVTHDQEEAFAYADRVAVMKDGVILQCDTPENVYLRPSSEDVAMFLGNCQFLYGEAHGDIAETPIGKVQLNENLNGKVKILLRPESLLLEETEDSQFEILENIFHGGYREITVGNGSIVLKAHKASYRQYTLGTKVNLSTQNQQTAFLSK